MVIKIPKGIPKSGRKPGNPNISNVGIETRFTKETAAVNGSKGQAALAMVKSFREYFEDNLAKTNSKGDTIKDNISKAVINKALAGDAQAVQLVLRLIGEMPSDKVAVTVTKTDTAALEALESVVLNDTRTSNKSSS